MVEKSSLITGEESAPKEIAEIDELKILLVDQMRKAEVKFPIRNKDELKRIYPMGTPQTCIYKGKEVSIHDLIESLEESSFPINNVGDAATLLTSKCLR
ncbi:hypothetical protein CUJ83_11670 [Methanocella sp. CWC-04]|uniref:Uncharacterized protein n=1 Tax=Methanooceanicella nereidis TaxID=2052831 RepID=A0AAP2RFI7_9EURY|nr:MTH865 family protein [Methanocella sp. CWC-04]MCD1295655.1 hypothetical protein [Methanocella sp. CWC-04]